MEKVFGRHTAVIEDDFRVYWAQAGDSPLIAEVLAATDAFTYLIYSRALTKSDSYQLDQIAAYNVPSNNIVALHRIIAGDASGFTTQRRVLARCQRDGFTRLGCRGCGARHGSRRWSAR